MTIMNDTNAREKLQVQCLLKCGSECAPPSRKHVCLKTFFLDGILEAIAARKKRLRDEGRANAPADWSASSHDDDDHEAGGESSLPLNATPRCTNCGYQYQGGYLWCPQCSQSVPTTGVTEEQKDVVLERQVRRDCISDSRSTAPGGCYVKKVQARIGGA